MTDLAGTSTHDHLLAAFVQVCQASRSTLWFAQQADIEGRPEAAHLLRSLAERQTGHALGHLEFLAEVGDPITGRPIGDTTDNLDAALTASSSEHVERMRQYAEVARTEGLDTIAEWFATVARDQERQAQRLRTELEGAP